MDESKYSFLKELLVSEKLCSKITDKILVRYNLSLDTYLYLNTIKNEKDLYKDCIKNNSCKETEEELTTLGYLENNKISNLGREVIKKIITELDEIVETQLDDRTKDNLFMAETALKRLNKNMLTKV